MNRRFPFCMWMIVAVILSLNIAYAQFDVLETPNLRLIYFPLHEYVTPHVARCFENALRFHERLFAYTPSEKVTVLMHDLDDYGSGGTSTIPWNYITVCMEPFDYVYETRPANERMNWLMNHELVHVVATDKAADGDALFRSVFFGKVRPTPNNPLSMFYSYLTSPRWYSPRWYHEGIAVFMETWMAGGIGRALGGYDEMVFRTMVRDSTYFYDYVGLESEGTTIDFQIGANSYLYGTRFMSYLAEQYGPEKLIRWVGRIGARERYFASGFRAVYGTSLSDEWPRWIEWEHRWQEANLDSLRRYPITPYRPIVPEALGAISRAFYDSSRARLYVAVNLPGQIAHIAAINPYTGSEKTVCRVPTPAMYYVCSTAYDLSSGTLFFTTHNSTSWRDVRKVDVQSGRTTLLLEKCRIGDLAFNHADSSLWGVQHHDGFSTIVRIPAPYTRWENILTIEYGKDVYDIDISHDGRYLAASLVEVNGRQRLIRMETRRLRAGDPTYEVLYEFENNSPMNFVFSSDDRYIFGTTYFTGVSNVVRYDTGTKEMRWVTNTETGFFRPVPISPDSLLVFRYTGKGFLPVMIRNETLNNVSAIAYLGNEVVERFPIVKGWNIGPPSAVNIDSLTTAKGSYNSWKDFGLASAYPVAEGYKTYTSVGMKLSFQDPLAVNALSLDGSYTPQKGVHRDERLHLNAALRLWQLTIGASMNRTDFYDLFGPTRTSRKGFAGSVQYNDFLILNRPEMLEYSLALRTYRGLDRLPEYQNVSTSSGDFSSFSGSLRYSLLLRSLGAVDYESGVAAALENYTSLVGTKLFSRTHGEFSWGFPLPWNHSSLWVRTSLGYSPGPRDEPFANFYFGGFGNNWVDRGEERRYRDYYSFPGVPLNNIGGSDFVRGLAEWTLPPLRFRRFGVPDCYVTWARLALFSAALFANPASTDGKEVYADAGAQLDLKLVLFSNLSSTFSLGAALATGKNHRATHEFMISLKLL